MPFIEERDNRVFCNGAEPSFQGYRRAKEMIVSWRVHCLGSVSVGRRELVREWDRVLAIR